MGELVGIGGEPIGTPTAPAMKEAPISPKINAELKTVQQEFATAQGEAADLGLKASILIKAAGNAVMKMENAETALRKVMDKAAKASGVNKDQVRGFDTERGMALYE